MTERSPAYQEFLAVLADFRMTGSFVRVEGTGAIRVKDGEDRQGGLWGLINAVGRAKGLNPDGHRLTNYCKIGKKLGLSRDEILAIGYAEDNYPWADKTIRADLLRVAGLDNTGAEG